MQHAVKTMIAATLVSLAPWLAQAADEAPLIHQLGTKHRFIQEDGSPYPATGCRDHRTLMFIVSEIGGEDASTAKLLIERDCRPLIPNAEYIRCGTGGWAYPAKGDRISYASYCRAGAKDIGLYALDLQMKLIEESQSPPRQDIR
jgi:hypothetical protein